VLLLIGSALALGFMHGLGADHLMAIAALSVGSGDAAVALPSRRARALEIALRFAAGHAALLAVGAGTIVALGWSLPLMLERSGEILGGLLLVIMGIAGLWGIAAGRIYGHTHVHGHEAAPHWHLHVGRPERHPRAPAHSHIPTIVGAAFAISSLRAVALLAPALTGAHGLGGRLEDASLSLLFGLIAVFAIGILLSMSLFGIAFARLISAAAVARLGRAAAIVMAAGSVALGVFWIASA
jgi:hypothetical protein